MESITMNDECVILVNDIGSNDVNLFNTIKFHSLHNDLKNSYYFTLFDNKREIRLAVARFMESEPGAYTSIVKGTFGGFECIKEIPLELMEEFTLKVESFLKSKGAKYLKIIQPPLIYNDTEISLWMNILFQQGFTISNIDLNYSIDVHGDFYDKISHGNKKKINQAFNAGLSVKRLQSAEYEEAYRVLAENRAKKGNSMSMTWEAVKKMNDTLPEVVHMFGVFQSNKMIASAMCVMINPKTLYVLYWGEIAGVETHSPVTFLCNEIFNFCIWKNISLLDIGISTLHGAPNYGLIRYKKNLGCTESLKLTLSKTL